jgi:hypothetical protein
VLRSEDVLEDDDGWLPAAGAVVAGLAALYAAALATGMLDGVPLGRQRGQAAPVAAAGPAVAGGGGHGPAAAVAPAPRMRFHGPGGELFEFPPAQHRFSAVADAGSRGAGAP